MTTKRFKRTNFANPFIVVNIFHAVLFIIFCWNLWIQTLWHEIDNLTWGQMMKLDSDKWNCINLCDVRSCNITNYSIRHQGERYIIKLLICTVMYAYTLLCLISLALYLYYMIYYTIYYTISLCLYYMILYTTLIRILHFNLLYLWVLMTIIKDN